jgi:microcystin-dependent protein
MEEDYIGMLMIFADGKIPQNYFKCDGRTLQIRDQQALYSIIDNAFGGDGVQTFALPKLDGPRPGTVYGICWQGEFPVRA